MYIDNFTKNTDITIVCISYRIINLWYCWSIQNHIDTAFNLFAILSKYNIGLCLSFSFSFFIPLTKLRVLYKLLSPLKCLCVKLCSSWKSQTQIPATVKGINERYGKREGDTGNSLGRQMDGWSWRDRAWNETHPEINSGQNKSVVSHLRWKHLIFCHFPPPPHLLLSTY